MARDTTLFKPGGAGLDRGFVSVDMVLLLAVLVLFLAGVVGLTARGVSSSQSVGGSARVQEEADALLDRIETLASGARAVSRGVSGDSLTIVADLDGSGGSSSLAESPGETPQLVTSGMETVDIGRSPQDPGALLALVHGSNPESARVVLTRGLDSADPGAFKAGFRRQPNATGETGVPRVSEIEITVKLIAPGGPRAFARTVHLEKPAFLLP